MLISAGAMKKWVSSSFRSYTKLRVLLDYWCSFSIKCAERTLAMDFSATKKEKRNRFLITFTLLELVHETTPSYFHHSSFTISYGISLKRLFELSIPKYIRQNPPAKLISFEQESLISFEKNEEPNSFRVIWQRRLVGCVCVYVTFLVRLNEWQRWYDIEWLALYIYIWISQLKYFWHDWEMAICNMQINMVGLVLMSNTFIAFDPLTQTHICEWLGDAIKQ